MRTGGVARAARDDASGRFGEGDAVGYVGRGAGRLGRARRRRSRPCSTRLCDDCEVVTVVAGEEAPLDEDAVAALVPGGVELDHHAGGQPAWWWLLAAE